MSFVIDANILMSILISGKAHYKIIVKNFDLIIPDYALVEIDKYHKRLLEKSFLKDEEHRQYAFSIFAYLSVIPSYLLSAESIEKATRLIGDTDPKDISYIALSMLTDTVLITRDIPVYQAARRKGYRKIILFEDFLRQYA